MLSLFDTALGYVTELEPSRPGKFSIYVCGPTVSGDPHLGHGRFTVVWDVLRRYLTWRGLDVRFVSNVTDIEDKIIVRAQAEGLPPEEVASRYERVWWQTMSRLGVIRPDETPHATGWVPEMVDLIGRLVDSGHAYLAGDGVYFAAETVDDYGLLARQPLDTLRAGARLEASEAASKRSPVDFVLWKLAKPGEPSWPSPWGPGRPGWHTECVVMSLGLLGEDFDLHTGGLDLSFPHHENERAQAKADGKRFTRHWAHNGMIVDEGGEKMSKSVGNTLSLLDLLDAYDPRAFRLQVLQAHYRSPMAVGAGTLESTAGALERLDVFAREYADAYSARPDQDALAKFRGFMDDDLDTPKAVALGFDLVKRARSARADEASAVASAVFDIFERALGLVLNREARAVPDAVLRRAAERDEARARRDWGAADAIRDELKAQGWTVEDGPSGTTVR
ncbi:MAG: cysteine--tRNA ligase [Acidimicrobiales bacterium]